MSTISARMTGEARTAGTMPVYKSAETKTGDDTSSHESGSFIDALKGFIDVINPLQHLPVIGTLYRKITGDEIAPMARMAGDTLFGGPIGAALAMIDIATESATGKDIGQNMMAMLDPDDKPTNNSSPATPPTMLADARDTTDFLRSPTPTGTAMEGNSEPVRHSYKSTVPVLSKDGNSVMAAPTPASEGKDLKRSFTSLADSTAVPTSQDAPAGSGRRPGSPGLIAAEMTKGLDKYRDARIKTTPPPSIIRYG